VILVSAAISLSQQLELEPLALLLPVMFAASTSFLSPIGCLLSRAMELS